MGMEKLDEVFDIEAHMDVPEPKVQGPLDPVIDLLQRQMDADRWFAQGLWYAYGRLANEEPILRDNKGSDPESTAWGFGIQYQAMMLEFRDRTRRDTVAMAKAWENYRASAGGTVDEI